VEVTGGEPLAQEKTPDLVDHLIEMGYKVLMETNGSMDIHLVSNQCIRIMDIKCPSSGESDHFYLENLLKLENSDQVKFVIKNREDYEYAINMKNRLRKDFPPGHILFSPVSGKLTLSKLAQWIIEDNLDVRYNLQLHKTIWPDKDRGA